MTLRSASFAISCALALTGCGPEVSSYAVPTTSLHQAPHQGPLAIYASRPPPPNAKELGIVEAHALADEGSIEKLFPELVARAAELGANALVIDWMGAKAQVFESLSTQDVLVPCGRFACSQTESFPVTNEVMTVVLRGRALRIDEGVSP